MMRLAACLATERGVQVCCPVHDAFLIEADAGETERMRAASALVLPGFPLETDAKIVRHPDRFTDPRGERMWRAVTGILDDLGAGATPHRRGPPPFRGRSGRGVKWRGMSDP